MANNDYSQKLANYSDGLRKQVKDKKAKKKQALTKEKQEYIISGLARYVSASSLPHLFLTSFSEA